MAINSNALSVNGSIAANASCQVRAPDSGGGPVSDAHTDPAAGATDGQAATGDSGSAGSSGSSTGSGSAGAAAVTASGQKAGPSAQTRNAQGSRAARSTHARGRATSAAGSQPAAAAQDAGEESSSDFGSVMASALGRSATAKTAANAPTKTPTGTNDTGSGATGTAPAATPPTDAMAWIAQILMTPAAAQGATATSAGAAPNVTVATDTKAGGRSGLPAALGATADGAAAEPNAATVAAGSAAAASRLKFTTDPLPQAAAADAGQPTVQTTNAHAALTAATNSPGAANVNALADVQRLISGLTGADSDPDTDSDAAATRPATHDTAAGSGTDAAQAAAALQAAPLTRADAGLGTASLTIRAPVGSAAFADDVSSKVTGLAQSGITQAQLQLNPSDLGPVQVHITMQAGQASVWFGATHSDTRAALEQSLPRLREMFAGAGLPLTDSGVFREPPQQQQPQSLPAALASRTTATGTAATASVTQVANVRLSLLDTYA